MVSRGVFSLYNKLVFSAVWKNKAMKTLQSLNIDLRICRYLHNAAFFSGQKDFIMINILWTLTSGSFREVTGIPMNKGK
ncbi:hypothetical protein LguiA_028038 [Lonicera macranthoides]